MKYLDYSYSLQLHFSAPVHRHAFQLRCIPLERPGQHPISKALTLMPNTKISYICDGYGNTVCFGLADAPHNLFSFEVRGSILLQDTPLPCTTDESAIYKTQTAYTQPGVAIQKLYQLTPKASDSMNRALAFMRTVRAQIAYVPASTTIHTTAEEAAAQKCGVCQDHTQILLSLLRMEGIPCRYVAGLLLGEGRTHAWAEACLDGCWIGLDATNGTVVRDTHIAIAVGRDHSECDLNRGTMLGNAQQTQVVQVRVTETTPKEERSCK